MIDLMLLWTWISKELKIVLVWIAFVSWSVCFWMRIRGSIIRLSILAFLLQSVESTFGSEVVSLGFSRGVGILIGRSHFLLIGVQCDVIIPFTGMIVLLYAFLIFLGRRFLTWILIGILVVVPCLILTWGWILIVGSCGRIRGFMRCHKQSFWG
jgi:hypothetical protein